MLGRYEQKRYQEAEDVWKSALQINQTDMRTQLYYAAMLREIGDSEKANQLLEQTMYGRGLPPVTAWKARICHGS